jgi:sortase A
MPRQRSLEDLSVDQLRQLLIEKRRAERQKRMDAFRRSGRVILVEPQASPPALNEIKSDFLPAFEEVTPPSKGKIWFDRFLFLVEVAAVLGLVFILYNGANLLQSLNREVSSALVMPTMTPTPLISVVVLPSGHTPPTDPGGVRFNEAEIPSHLRPLVQSVSAAVILPTPSPEQAIRIRIPAINVDAPIVQGDGWEQLKKGVGQHIGSPNPGLKGNVVLSAHNDVFGEIFRDLDKLKAGDQIIVYTQQRAYTYVVRGTQIVEPTRVEVMAPTPDAVVTLISCYPYLVNNRRIVVSATYQDQK